LTSALDTREVGEPDTGKVSTVEDPALLQALIESERRFRSAFNASPVGIGLSDETGRFIAVNPALCVLFARPENEVLGRSAAEFTHPDDLETHRQATELIESAPDGIVRIEKRYRRPDGEIRWAWLTVTHVEGPDELPWTLAHVQDVTERKNVELALRESEANLVAVAAVVRRIQSGEDARGTIVEAARALSGAQVASLLEPDGDDGESAQRLVVSASTDSALLDEEVPLHVSTVTGQVYLTGSAEMLSDPLVDPRLSAPLLAKTGARSICVLPISDTDGVTGVLSVGWPHRVAGFDTGSTRALMLLADEAGLALHRERLLQELERLATTDELTGLPNRRAWDLRVGQLMAAARRGGAPLTVAIGDIDHFKFYNDTRGHGAGDALLRRFASAARAAIRQIDFIARWGGEEFVLALPGCLPSEAESVLARVRATVPDGQSCSFGFAGWDGEEGAAQLIQRADAALYQAKASGRDRVVAAEY
jgi:diguanylate cyclase